VEAWHREGVGDRLSEISAATLIAAGTADRVIPSSNSLALTSRIPESWLLRFRGGGHAFMAQHPTSLSSFINQFLAL
jgi:pimeloyl-ACP methyl ester carboxylesterase